MSKVKANMGFFEVHVNKDYEILMDNFLTECKNLDIQVILVYSPVYVEGQRFILTREEIMNIYTLHGINLRT